MNKYRNISDTRYKNPDRSPLSYCIRSDLDNEFSHGAISESICSPYGRNCQSYMSDYCAAKWDGICENLSKDRNINYPNSIDINNSSSNLTAGEILISNTASRKYLKSVGNSCELKSEPFDPTVASSPLIHYWVGDCEPEYRVDPKTIDSDPVMNKILDNPRIAWTLLVNIYRNCKRRRDINSLRGTRLYKFYTSDSFQRYIYN